MKQITSFLFILIVAISCKKDKLVGDKEIFLGDWVWHYSIHSGNVSCGSTTFSKTIYPQNEEFSMNFLKKGVVLFYKNNNEVDKKRIVFEYFEERDIYFLTNAKNFTIDLNNSDKYDNMGGYINSDTMVLINYFPYKYEGEYNCETYLNYFVRK
jgi:hypothetical protein